MPLIETKGAASAQGFGGIGGGSSGPVNYIEDVFSTYLYTGNGSTQTITNGIDLAGEGGLVWTKNRTTASNPQYNYRLYDSVRGINASLISNNVSASDTLSVFTSWNADGFTLGGVNPSASNVSSEPYVSWTFREQPKFFDIVTYTGNGANRTISHNLGSVPGCIIVKRTDASANWQVYHRSLANTEYLVLNDTAAKATGTTRWNSTTPTSTVFSLGTDTTVNASGGTYVAYLFAHDAGGFGLSGTDNVISCGSATYPSEVSLGYNPQWIMFKRIDSTSDWYIYDTMRGLTYIFNGQYSLSANTTNIEVNNGYVDPITNGFVIRLTGTYIYIAIRRGPMKVPTSGTSVFGANARSGTGANATVTGGQIADAALIKNRGSAVGDLFASRLTGTGYLETSSTAAEVAAGTTILQANPWDVMDGVNVGTTSTITNASGNTFINYLFRRAPSFFDEVCYTGDSSTPRTITHNLTVVPELMFVKSRSNARGWAVYASGIGANKYLILNGTNAALTDTTIWANTAPTSSVFTVGSPFDVNNSSYTYVAYLFATCAGVSKVGSYTGTGTTLQVNCGFTGGSRFVLIKRTDSTGDWYVWDSARGIVAGNDSYLVLNSTAAEVTTTDWVDTYSAGFELSNAAGNNVNINGASYIFLSVA